MAVTFGDLQKAYAALAERDVPASLEEIERLTELLRRYASQESFSDESSASSTGLLPKNIERVTANLPSLLVGPAPEGLDERVKNCWEDVSKQWATRSTLDDFRQRLTVVLKPLEQNEERLAQAESDLDDQRVRLATLKKLADLLDDLLETADAG